MQQVIMFHLPLIFKRTQTGAIQEWLITIEGNSFFTTEGQTNGKKTISKPTIVKGKNIGRSNETTACEQALKQAKSKWTKKIETGYTEDIKKIDIALTYFSPMLAHKYNNYKTKIKFPVLVSAKIDGARVIATKNGLYTRNGKEYLSCPHINKLLKPLFKVHPTWVIDGEVYSHDNNFEKIMSLVKKKKPKEEDLKASEEMVKLWVFDGVIDDKKCEFKNRFNMIKNEITNLIPDYEKHIVFVENKIANNHEEVVKAHDKYVEQGYEGVMIRIVDSPYECKRSKNLLKLKSFQDDEFEILEIIEGIRGRSNMAGKIKVKDKQGNIFGAGIKGGEEYYKELLKNKDKLVGKLATVRYQELSKDGIPRFPVVVNIDPIDR